MKRKNFFTLFFIAVMLFSVPAYAGAGTIYLNDIPLGVNISVMTMDGYVYVPLRKIADMVGAKLDWDEKTKTVTVYDPFSIQQRALTELKIGEKKAVVYPVDEKGKSLDAVEVEMEAAPVIIDSKTYLPLNFIVENLGYTSEYDKKTGNIYLKD